MLEPWRYLQKCSYLHTPLTPGGFSLKVLALAQTAPEHRTQLDDVGPGVLFPQSLPKGDFVKILLPLVVGEQIVLRDVLG